MLKPIYTLESDMATILQTMGTVEGFGLLSMDRQAELAIVTQNAVVMKLMTEDDVDIELEVTTLLQKAMRADFE